MVIGLFRQIVVKEIGPYIYCSLFFFGSFLGNDPLTFYYHQTLFAIKLKAGKQCNELDNIAWTVRDGIALLWDVSSGNRLLIVT